MLHLVKGARQPNYQLSYELPLHPHIIGCVYPMASVDRLVVQRTWALLENARSSAVPEDADAAARRAYGSALVYDEFVKTPSAYGKLGASAFSLGFGLLVAACAFAPVGRAMTWQRCGTCSSACVGAVALPQALHHGRRRPVREVRLHKPYRALR
jgi:hypothetical protein